MLKDSLVVVRGGGDLATGTIHKLHRCGFPVVVLESRKPSAIRRYVAFSEAVYESTMTVEGITCRYAGDIDGSVYTDISGERSELHAAENTVKETIEKTIKKIMDDGEIPLFTDPEGILIDLLSPWAVVDAILAKKNVGTSMDMAPVTVALGPGFTAGTDVKIVVETKRGHDLGRLIYEGAAVPNSGVPGLIGGYGKERVSHAEAAGVIYGVRRISDLVEAGETIAVIRPADEEGRAGQVEVKAAIKGVLRGLIRDGYEVTKGFKIADVDPRESEKKNCFTISDKARCIAGGVAEALMSELQNR
ncbi:MAG: EF2563 family selenium-dependent molybdenum hydroxylase system protein [Lachnospiraceae bacterium]|nr:EF2563 family selenium-dependent molybdenum hydroxylase system protein [Lachnospiraceae bacterium]